MSRVPVAWRMLPAQKNSAPFMRAWFQTCNSAAVSAMAAIAGSPAARPQRPTPSASAIRPTFSMLE
jgi:hypothetical protein